MPHGGPHPESNISIPELDIDAAVAQVNTGLPVEDPDPYLGPGGIGMPPDQAGISRPTPYSGDWKDAIEAGAGNVVPYAPRKTPIAGTEEVFFQYRASSPNSTLFDMSPVAILGLQRQMIDAGLLDKVTGYADIQTQNAMANVMGQANVRGTNWREALTDLVGMNQAITNDAAKNGGFGGVRATPTFTYDPYLPPDYDTIVTNVEQLFREHLGRAPEDYELTILADKMSALHRADYDAQYQGALQKFESQDFVNRQALLTENQLAEGQVEGGNPDAVMGDPLINPAETGPNQVDVASSVYQFFKSKYGNELDRVEAMRQGVANRELTTQSLLALNQMGAGNVNEL